VKLLAAAGAPLEAQARNKATALHCAALQVSTCILNVVGEQLL
jgi:hypothetical protein